MAKAAWFKQAYHDGLRLQIAVDDRHQALGFIEYVPAEYAWRPVIADHFLFIHCIMVYSNANKNAGVGSALLNDAEHWARNTGKLGLCAMSSAGSWMAGQSLFAKNGFEPTDERGRFVMMTKRFATGAPSPAIRDWTSALTRYQGWHLVYANQCPWHQKSVVDLQQCAAEHGIDLQVTELKTPADAQAAPSGYGTFSLIKDGRLLEDHYISRTRFENILKKEK
ncbi:MAG: hypothetical protein IT259_13725 [Saprospiraceae bacterium]|nr:hypothetical protein [Saprospiraceae bacterium]